MRSQRFLVTALVGFVAFLSGGWLLQRGQQGGNVYQRARLFDDVLTYVSEYYVDSLDEGKLYDLAIDGFLQELNDPYTTFLREEDYRDLELSTTGNYSGVGMEIDVRDGWITVIAPIAGTPAEDAGINAGDRIVQIDGESTRGWTNGRAVTRLRGQAGSKVRLTIARPGLLDSLRFEVARARIHVKSVKYATELAGDVGYVSLANSSISESTARELGDEIARLRERGARSLILDLRNNPGGVLDQGVAVADLFLEPGQVVVETRGRAPGATQTFKSEKGQRWPEMPIAVLVDGYTASAAEIIAGALQDHDRALVLGTTTFGKGLVQSLYQLNRTEFLKLTTGRWYTPSGRTIQRPMNGVRVAAAEPVSAGGAAHDTPALPDTTRVFRTTGGRVVRGGGGIRPDIELTGDTLSDAEQEFARTLGARIPVYRDVLTSYALELKGGGTIASPGFQVSPPMRAELLRRLRARGVEIPMPVWDAARELVDQQFGYEVIRYVFGRPAEFARRTADDGQVQRAVALLKQARTPKELLALASRGGD